MSKYSVILMPQAQKDLDAFSGKQLTKFEKTILRLYDEPRPHNSIKPGAADQGGVSESVHIEYCMKLMIRKKM